MRDGTAATSLSIAAPAKINLALHVVGQRADGYHGLETLVVFTGEGDTVDIAAAAEDGFTINGPEARGLAPDDPDNLVLRARDAVRAAARNAGHETPPVAITLLKRLPVSSGIGGGSADAAATLSGLCRVWKLPSALDLEPIAASLGADVPMCLSGCRDGQSLIASGIGEELRPAGVPAGLALVLVNPRVPVATPSVFKALRSRRNPPLPPLPLQWPREAEECGEALAGWLQGTRNDLMEAAMSLRPEIAAALSALTASGSLFARMSGSGATCFGLFGTMEEAAAAAGRMAQLYPDWFVSATATL